MYFKIFIYLTFKNYKSMKKKLFLRLCLMFLVGISAFSCRTDQFPENETFNNSSKFQLTSKRISLDESKHKNKIIPLLEKTTNDLQKIKTSSAFGRTITYGDSISIDTDDVLLMENGPNYYTYTFSITRKNASPHAPVENLVLSPMSDGTYRELLVTYNLTEQEKELVRSGKTLDLKDKTEFHELASGTFSSGLASRVTCRDYLDFVYTICNGNDHHSNGEAPYPEGPCRGTVTSQLVVVIRTKCEYYQDVTDGSGWMFGSGGSPSTGGGSEGNNNNPPVECDDPVLQNPQDIDFNSGNNPCGSGVATQPNLPLPNKETPCKQLQSLKDKAGFSEKMITLKNNVENGAKEKGFILHNDATTPTSDVIEGGSPHDPADINFKPYYESISMDLLLKTYGSVHAHLKNHPNHIGVPTPEDFNQLLTYGLIETNPQNPNQKPNPEKAVMLVITKIGLFAIKISDLAKMKAYISKYMLWSDDQKKKYVKDNFFNNKKYNILPTSTHDQQVTGFLRFLQDMEVGADLYEGNPATYGDWKKLNLVKNTNGTFSYNQTPCTL